MLPRPALRIGLSSLLWSLPAVCFAHGVDLAKFASSVVIKDGIEDCAKLGEWDDRTACYATLCEPSYQCAEALVVEATEHAGPVVGTKVLDDLLVDRQKFNTITDGHEFSHLIGRTAAKVYGVNGDAFDWCPPDYLYGCQHGFFEQAIADSDAPEHEVALSICEGITKHPVERRKFYCYHGVGHGMMMAKGNDIYATVRACDQLPYGNAARGCWQGAFMENVNAETLGKDRATVFDAEDPLAPCNRVPLQYQWECYENHSAHLMKAFSNDVVAASKSCLEAHKQTLPACTLSLAQLTTNPGWQKLIVDEHPELVSHDTFLENAVELCSKFPRKTVWQCYMSAMNNMLNYDQYEDALTYCALVPTSGGSRRDCFQRLGNELRWRGKSADEVLDICKNASEQYRENCLQDAEVKVFVPPRIAANEYEWRKPGEPAEYTVYEPPKKDPGFWGTLKFIVSWPLRLFSSEQEIPSLTLPPPMDAQSSAASASAAPSAAPGGTAVAVIRLVSSTAFEPSEVTIRPGETITWINDTGDLFWPASDVHPTHEILPAFDAKKPLKPENAYSFTFTQLGSWTFHDHMHPNAVGVVHVVEEAM